MSRFKPGKQDHYANFNPHNHRRDPVQVGQCSGLLLGSEYTPSFDIFEPPVPKLGVYLSSMWKDMFTQPDVYGELQFFEPAQLLYPVIVLPVPDGSTTNARTLGWLVSGIVANLDAGNHVEIACVGGHGRTGTLMACVVGRVEALTAKEAILAVRARYCESAVETLSQGLSIAKFLDSPIDGLNELLPERTYFGEKDIPIPTITPTTNLRTTSARDWMNRYQDD